MKSSVFVSYRRMDNPAMVGRLTQSLQNLYGKGVCFHDVHTIEYGERFKEVIENSIRDSKVILVMIGTEWLRRKADPDTTDADQVDYVVLESSLALKHGKPIIPVLMGSAELPAASELPTEIAPILDLNLARLRDDPDFSNDFESLARRLERIASLRRKRKGAVAIAAVSLIAIAASVFGLLVWQNAEETNQSRDALVTVLEERAEKISQRLEEKGLTEEKEKFRILSENTLAAVKEDNLLLSHKLSLEIQFLLTSDPVAKTFSTASIEWRGVKSKVKMVPTRELESLYFSQLPPEAMPPTPASNEEEFLSSFGVEDPDGKRKEKSDGLTKE